MVAEFDAEAKRGHEVDNENGVHLHRVTTQELIEKPHAAHELEEDQEDAESDYYGDAQRGEDLQRQDHSGHTQEGILSEDTPDVGVLIIEDVEE